MPGLRGTTVYGRTVTDAIHDDATGAELVKRLTRQVGGEYPGATKGLMPPEGFNADALAADVLRQSGIPGIRYLDAGSRAPGWSSLTSTQLDARINALRADIAGGGGDQAKMSRQLSGLEAEREKYNKQTHNFVLFDDTLPKILSRE